MTERELNALPAELSAQLRYLDRKVRALAVLRGVGVVCVVLCAGIAVGVLTDWLLDLWVGVRTAILMGVLGSALAATVIALLKPLFRRTSSAELAALVDTSFPDLGERVESAVELANPDLSESHKGSAYMRSRLMRETIKKSSGVDFGAAADTSSAARWVFVALLGFLLVVAPFGLSKDGYGLMLTRFLMPWRNLERATNLFFDVPDGDRTTARGDDVTILAKPQWRLAPGELPDFAWLNWKNADGETDERRMEWSESVSAYTATLPHVFTSFDFTISAGRTRTKEYHVEVVERPDVAELTLEIVPPAYTAQATQTLDGAVGRTEVFERSELTFELAFNKAVTTAEFVWLPDSGEFWTTKQAESGEATSSTAEIPESDRLPLTLRDDRTGGRIALEANRSGPYALVLRDEHDLESQANVSRELIVVPDVPPQVRWSDLDPAQLVNIPPLEAKPDDSLSLPVKAEDDFGVDDLALHMEVIQRSEALGPLPADSPLMGQPIIAHEFDVELSSFELRHGDLISVRARAVDSRPVPAPQIAWTAPRLIRISNDADPAGLRALMQEQQKLRDAIEQIKQDVNDDREAARGLNSEAAEKQKKNEPLGRQPELAELAERERDVQQRLEQLAVVFEDHPLQRTMAEQTRAIADEPIEAAKEHLQQAEAEPIRQQRERLRKATNALSTADKQLEELLKQFDELAALERDLQQLQQLAEEAEQLADDVDQFERDWNELERLQKEESLSPQQSQKQESQLADRQLDLQDEQQDLASALDHLLEERPEILDAARQRQIEKLDQLADQAQKLAEHQNRLATAMSREKPNQNAADDNEPTDPQTPPERATDPTADEDTPQPDANEPSPAERQQQLADDAARQALETARQQGVESAPAQEARQFAQRARKAAEEAERGLLAEAANSAKQAAQSAEKTSQQMSESVEPPPTRMTEQAEALAEQQAQVAEQLRESSRSAEERQSAQQQGQQQIAEETDRLAQEFAETTQRLESTPLNEEQAGERSRSAQESTEQAQAAQQQAQQQLEQQGQRQASQPARQAAKSLQQAARQAAQAGTQSKNEEPSPVPGDVGEQVSDARRQLEQAGQQLQQATPRQQGQQGQSGEQGESSPQGEASEGNPGEQPGDMPGESPEGTPPSENGESSSQDGQSAESGNQPGQDGQPGPDQGQSPSGQSDQPGQNGQPTSEPGSRAGSESMRQVAESLQQAAQQMGLQPSQRSQNQGQDQQSGNSDQGADGPQGGYGARGGLSLAELEAELGRISARDWGQLPDRVETELQQAQQKKPDSDYARLIRLYFEEVARRQSATEGLQTPADNDGSPIPERPSDD